MFPPVFHITHWKAGSQWIKKILLKAFPDNVVLPAPNPPHMDHFLKGKLEEGKIFSTVYLARGQFYSREIPENSSKFLMIRDLRDTLVSGYYSMKISHGTNFGNVSELRKNLTASDMERGMIYLMDSWLIYCANVQTSWLQEDIKTFKYEDLLNDDVGILTDVLIKECKLPITENELADVIESFRFKKLTGREPGAEDPGSHERKGIAGDYKNHFTERITDEFKSRFADVLIKTGYEKDTNW